MLSSLSVYLILCFTVGTAVVIAMLRRARQFESDCTIARVLYDTEHPAPLR
jgi:hypothetical protein